MAYFSVAKWFSNFAQDNDRTKIDVINELDIDNYAIYINESHKHSLRTLPWQIRALARAVLLTILE